MKEYCISCRRPLHEWEWCGRGLCEGCEDLLDNQGLVASPFIPLDGKTQLLPVPNDDMYRVIVTQEELDRYVVDYGVLLVRYDAKMRRWECPALEMGRQRFVEHKKRDCDQHGCE